MNSASSASLNSTRPVAVVGAGLSGARCAAVLRDAGCDVIVFDKARGPGGRLATRRGAWSDREGNSHAVSWDHGAPGFEAQSPDFLAWLQAQAARGRAHCWQPRLAGGGRGPLRWRGLPTQPALCQALLGELPVHGQQAIQGLARDRAGWMLRTETACHGPYSAVVLALPPAQAAPLLAPYRDDWARAASVVPMQPCWTLMGVSELNAADGSETDAPDWWVPQGGPIERLMRQSCEGGTWTWVAHASPSWSREHLECSPDTAEAALRQAVETVLGHPLPWRMSVVHRWRYARPVLTPSAGLGGSRWDAGLGLGLCGDYLAGLGADAAWTSGTALAQRILAAGPLCHAPPPLGRADGVVLLASAPR